MTTQTAAKNSNPFGPGPTLTLQAPPVATQPQLAAQPPTANATGTTAEIQAESDPKPAKRAAALDRMLYRNLDDKASDLHLAVGTVPWQSVYGRTKRIEGFDTIDALAMEETLRAITTDEGWAKFLAEKRLDFSYATERSRFRCHYAIASEEPMAVFRTISNEIPRFDDLGLPDIIRSFATWESGLVIFIGVTGSGKTSSLAALIDIINETEEKKIISVEAPVEYIHPHKKSMVVQREVGRDVDSFAIGIEDAMREAPDVILVGEMRDAATMSAAISAATSGHLVFATMHAESTADAPTRILDSMPPGRVDEVRSSLSRSLRAVVYQKLIPLKHPQVGRAVATEVLNIDAAISNMIRTNKLEGIQGKLMDIESGNITFARSLHDLVNRGLITERSAKRAELKKGSFNLLKPNQSH